MACFVGNYDCTQRISKQAKCEAQNVKASLNLIKINYCNWMMKDFATESAADFPDLM